MRSYTQSGSRPSHANRRCTLSNLLLANRSSTPPIDTQKHILLAPLPLIFRGHFGYSYTCIFSRDWSVPAGPYSDSPTLISSRASPLQNVPETWGFTALVFPLPGFPQRAGSRCLDTLFPYKAGLQARRSASPRAQPGFPWRLTLRQSGRMRTTTRHSRDRPRPTSIVHAGQTGP